MAGFDKTPKFFLRLLHFPPRVAYFIGLGPIIGNIVLLLTTTGRKSGKKRITPLQYEEIDGKLFLGVALGQKADWFRNIQANPNVQIHMKNKIFRGHSEIITDARQIADFLEIKLERHPKMVGAMLRVEGIALPPQRDALEKYAEQLTLVAIQPDLSK
jgi:deazaflavin-dependent oxidoreductase (nitroreductase family)